MTTDGTAAYDACDDLPPLVADAVAAALKAGFTKSCRPPQGRLLQVLASGVGAGTIGETGTGCGVGLAWLASAAPPNPRISSIERNPRRARKAQSLFAGDPRVRTSCGNWRNP